MCGICGFYERDDRADRHCLVGMNEAIVHRGPDDDGFFVEGQVGLAARRLSIIDLETGHQPLESPGGSCWMAYNGEVYNYRALRSELEAEGVHFSTQTDTEVIVALYEKKGMDFLKHLRGMFAVAIYDRRNQNLILARDPVGIKPLHYTVVAGTLVFGSEIKSILRHPLVRPQLNVEALDLYLSLEYVPAPHSLYAGIHKLPAGHCLTFHPRTGLNVQRYWDVSPETRNWTLGDARDRFRELLHESVGLRMIADVPLGAFLSGGVDSSAVVASMASQSTRPVETFSIGFEERSYNELPWARKVSGAFGTNHLERVLKPDILDLVELIGTRLDEPLGDFSNFPTYLVSRTARERVTVSLSGDGGDELFGGYEHYVAQKMASQPGMSLANPWLRLLGRTLPPSPHKKGWVNRIRRYAVGLAFPAEERHFRWMQFLTEGDRNALYRGDLLDRAGKRKGLQNTQPFGAYLGEADAFPGLNADCFLDVRTYLADNILTKVDRMSMLCSLEARVPLLDKEMVAFAFSLPPEWKVRGRTTKWFMKEALEGILPREVIHRRKEGFSIPMKHWLKGPLRDLMHDLLQPGQLRGDGLFDEGCVSRWMREHLEGKEDHAHRLWALMLFHLWKRNYLP